MATNSKRIAAFDIGTVTCRLLLAEVQNDVLHELERRCVITNLGVGVDKTGVLQEDAIQRVVAQIGEYIEIVNSYRTEQQPKIPIVAVATSASRDAKNSDALVGKLHDLGVELSVIEGEREAALVALRAGTKAKTFWLPISVAAPPRWCWALAVKLRSWRIRSTLDAAV